MILLILLGVIGAGGTAVPPTPTPTPSTASGGGQGGFATRSPARSRGRVQYRVREEAAYAELETPAPLDLAFHALQAGGSAQGVLPLVRGGYTTFVPVGGTGSAAVTLQSFALRAGSAPLFLVRGIRNPTDEELAVIVAEAAAQMEAEADAAYERLSPTFLLARMERKAKAERAALAAFPEDPEADE